MDDRNLHLPLDFESRVQFRALEARCGKETALAALMILYRVLGYAAQDGGMKVGYLDAGQMELLWADLEELGGRDPEFPVGQLVEETLLEKVEDDWFCKLFAGANAHLAADFVPMHRAGGLARAVKLKRQQAEAESVKQVSLLSDDLFHKVQVGTGQTLEFEDRNLVMTCIKLFDNVLLRAGRNPSEYSEGLMLDAVRVVKAFSKDQIETVATFYMNRRGAPMPKTEDVMRDFETHFKTANN